MINSPDDSLNIARKIFEGTKYHASDTDIQKLAETTVLLEKRGLGKLNQRLIDGGRKVWDTFSELNFALMLIAHHSHEVLISYEPNEKLRRPPDFKIVIGKLTYWVQMKKLSNLEKENRQNNLIRQIKTAAQKIETGMFFGCELSEQFSENDVADFITFIAKYAGQSISGKEYFFPNNENPKAKVDFWPANKSKLSSLTLGTYGDLDMVEVTGLVENQIKESLINAAGAFEWDIDQYTINLVAMDADHHADIDLCDAVFGTEFEIFRGNRHTWSRKDDGFFTLPIFSNKIAGVIAMKRKEQTPISNCLATLFINDKFKEHLDDLNNLLTFDKVIYFNMRPPMGKGDFDITKSSIPQSKPFASL